MSIRDAAKIQRECGCGPCGSAENYNSQVLLPIGVSGVKCVDKCIADIVAVLNTTRRTKTVACCCGHGQREGSITLEDGRELIVILPSMPKLPERFTPDVEAATHAASDAYHAWFLSEQNDTSKDFNDFFADEIGRQADDYYRSPRRSG